MKTTQIPAPDKTFAELQQALETWTPLAASVEKTSPGQPITVLTGEAIDLCFTMVTHWEPAVGRPGLKSAVISHLIAENTAFEIRETTLALAHCHQLYRGIEASNQIPLERAEFLLFETKQCLQFLFDDDVEDDRDAELARLSESHSDTSTHDALALSLEGFALYANRFRAELDALPEFSAEMIDEALVLSERVREHSAVKLSGMQKSEQQRYLALRNGLVTLLQERVLKARRAARFVFRHHPQIAAKFGSTYERRRRAKARAARNAEATQNGTPTTQEASV
jgi:hypothetical protein